MKPEPDSLCGFKSLQGLKHEDESQARRVFDALAPLDTFSLMASESILTYTT